MKKSTKEREKSLIPEEAVSSAFSGKGIGSVIVGISGGADSVALLLSLMSTGIKIYAVHCNFHLRGNESERDMRFTEQLCRRLGIDLDIVHFDVERYKIENGGSTEMACRNLRYDYFREKMKERACDRIAVAHNRDDNAETVLLNLFRGGGISGLRGMKVDNGEIIRPLLGVGRSEIEEYLEQKGETYIVDSSNLSNDYRRNYIRNVILPVIEKEWQGVKVSINRTARIMEEEERFLEMVAEGEISGNLLEYRRIEEPVKGEWLLRRFVMSKGGTHHIADEMIRSCNAIDEGKGARWIIKGGEFVMGPQGVEWIEKKGEEEEGNLGKEFEWIRHEFSESLFHRIKMEKENSRLWTSLPPERVRIRHRKDGDRMHPLGMRGSRLVSDMMRDARFSAAGRVETAVAEDMADGEILWVEGLRRSRKGLVLPDTSIVWELRRRKHDSGSRKDEK